MIRKVVFIGLALSFHLAVANASDSETVAALRACAGEKDDGRRLACYDALTSETDRSAAAPAVAASAEQSFGYRGSVAREELDRQEAQKPKIEQLTARVTAIAFQPQGEFVVTLENDQVWMQKRPEPKIRPAVGETVTIKPGALGSFTLITAAGRSTRVSRVR